MDILNSKKVYTYFKNRFVLKKSTNGFLSFDCPFCIGGEGMRKHAVNIDWGVCKCWVCGFKGYITDFVKDYENVSYFQAKELIEAEIPTSIDLEAMAEVATEKVARRTSALELPFGFKSLLEGDGILGVRARKYLKGRGFDLEQLDNLGFGYCNEHAENKDEDYFGYIIVPFKKRGQLVYYIGRDYTGNFLRYKNPPTELFDIGKSEILFNEDALFMCKSIDLMEGWTDAMTMGKSGVAMLGWQLSRDQKSKLYSSDCERINWIPDIGLNSEGRSFYKEAVKQASEFMDYKECYVLDLEGSGLLEFGKDVNEIGYARIEELKKNTPKLTYSLVMEILMK